MKKLMMALAAALMLPMMNSCTKDDEPEQEPAVGRVTIKINSDTIQTHKTITFGFSGDQVSQQSMTRGALASLNLTDLWVFDGDTLLLHQTADDDDFGAPTVSVDYGEHSFYFVASRGSEPTQSGTAITWEKPSDTFWQNVTLNIEPQTASSQAVTLQRVAARLRITITDEVPTGLATLSVTPSHWYYGLNILTGEAIDDRQTSRTVSVPASYIGTTGKLAASFYCISPSEAWQTDITLKATASDNATLSQISIENVPMQRNHITAYSGSLFSAGRSVSIDADDTWGDDIMGSW